jgi:hypothetical protein
LGRDVFAAVVIAVFSDHGSLLMVLDPARISLLWSGVWELRVDRCNATSFPRAPPTSVMTNQTRGTKSNKGGDEHGIAEVGLRLGVAHSSLLMSIIAALRPFLDAMPEFVEKSRKRSAFSFGRLTSTERLNARPPGLGVHRS